MGDFSVLVLTAPPVGMSAEAGGAMVKVDGRETLIRSVELFLNRDNVKQVQVVFAPEQVEEAKRKFGPHFGFSGVKIVGGGTRWMEQVAAGAEKLDPACGHVIVHDGARPAVPYSDIDAVMAAAEKHAAVVLTSPVRGTVLEVEEGAAVASHAAGRFVTALTPMAFSREVFLEMAKSRAEIHPSRLTILRGSPLNIRVGGAADAALARTMIAMLPKAKVKPISPFEEAQW